MVARVPSRTFCCCIPVRAGVIVLALLGLVGGSIIAAASIVNIHRDESSKLASVLQIIIYLLLALVSIFGLIGAIARRIGFVRSYLAMLIVHLLFSTAMGIFAINRNFKDAPKYIAECSKGTDPTDESILATCKNGATILKSLMIGTFIIAWLLETWACFIVVNYSKQLVEEERAELVKDTESW
ncbi:hypothetical protein BJ912DRAFT_952706 [Pholiota molesta]|nr:hypothetical protein BJ912DRAFT_952706 [Pholiota molesta]